ncbi:MAG: slipin family protein [Chloroflexi bacterium]|nr:slipin family protein [Chloroflexota bacterium]
MLYVVVVVVVVVLILMLAAIRIVQEYERGVVFRLGRYVGVRGPGFILLIPFIERMVKIDLRVITMDVPSQEAITRDNVTVKVNAVVYFRVVEASEAVLKVLDYIRATSLLAQTTLRNVLGQSDLDELLSQREKLNLKLQQIIDEGTNPWGIKVTTVEIKDVELPDSMKRAMAAQAEAERDRRAKIVHADGEFQASERLTKAAEVLSSQPSALQLRYLQTIGQIATERTTVVLFPLPIDLIKPFLAKVRSEESQK